MTTATEDRTPPRSSALAWTAAALGAALVGVAGSLWLSMGMGLKACPLCLYQRALLMAAGATLAVGTLTAWRHSGALAVLALPATIAGLGVAAFHVSLEAAGKLECPGGVGNLGTAPQQSLGLLIVLLVLLTIAALKGRGEGAYGVPAMALAALLGAGMAWGAVKSAPPMPGAPSAPYTQPLDMCRPPYREAGQPQG
jgi:disulfide bond formation protein DsbB